MPIVCRKVLDQYVVDERGAWRIVIEVGKVCLLFHSADSSKLGPLVLQGVGVIDMNVEVIGRCAAPGAVGLCYGNVVHECRGVGEAEGTEGKVRGNIGATRVAFTILVGILSTVVYSSAAWFCLQFSCLRFAV